MSERIVADERRPGIEFVSIEGGPGYDGELIQVSNGLSNGLRIEIANTGEDECGNFHVFHIHDPNTAKLIFQRLLEWSERIANPLPPVKP